MRALVPLLSLFLLGTQAQHGAQWTYSEGALDEAHWSLHYPTCGGQKQSPIDLQRRNVQYNPFLRPLNLTGYGSQAGDFSMINNGHTVQISLPSTMQMTTADGTRYIAQQMHFHWGGASSEISGSEHTIDGVRHVMEIHVVHYNSKYKSFDVAQGAPDGLAVLAAFIELRDYAENTYYSSFISHLANIRYPGQNTTLTNLDIRDMLPADLQHYYSYQGSLTTPPCSENVHWFVLADSVKLSKAQVLRLENSLLDHENKTIQNGYRRTQPLNHRVVEANFVYPSNQEYVLASELQSYLSKINNNLWYLRRFIEEKKSRRRQRWYFE